MSIELVEEHVYKHIDFDSEVPYKYSVRFYNPTTGVVKVITKSGKYKQVLASGIKLLSDDMEGFKIVLIDRVGLI